MHIKYPSCILILLIGSIVFYACARPKPVLEIVRNTPNYFTNYRLFGVDPKLMNEKNEFILETGMIDTTTEHRPVNTAMICIGHKTTQLTLTDFKKAGDETFITYDGDGYTLILSFTNHQPQDNPYGYEKAHISIRNGGSKTEYEVYSKAGYF